MAKTKGRPQQVGLASIPRELKPLARRARAVGWTIRATTSGHLLWQGPGSGEIMRTSASPSDCNVRWVVGRLMRKRGLTLA